MALDLGAIRARVVATNLAAHGVPITVTRPAPDDEPIEARGIWLTPETDGDPVGSTFQRREATRVIAVARAVVPSLPRGTLIEAPEVIDATVKTWRVDGTARDEPEMLRAFVHVTDETS